MKDKILFLVAVLIFCFCVSANAAGVGFFLEGAKGSGQWEYDDFGEEFDVDYSTTSIGFVLDTAPTNESFFNYRLNIGISKISWEDDFDSTLEGYGIYAENTFGFSLIKKDKFRWWFGPLIRVGVFKGEPEDYDDAEYTLGEIGVGIATGMNFKLGSALALAPSVGVRFSAYGGSVEDTYYDETEDLTGNSTIGFFNLALLF